MSKIERIKAAKDGLDVLPELLRAAREGWETLGFRARGIRSSLASEKSLVGEAASARTADRHGWPGARAPRWTGDPSLRN